MKKFIAVVGLVVLVVAAGLFYLRLRRPAPAGATLLPDSTLLLVRIPDFAGSRADLERSALFTLWQEPEVQTFLAQPRAAWQQAFHRGGVNLNDAVLGQVLDALRGEVFLAVTHFNVLGAFQAGVVFGADVKTDLLKVKLAIHEAERAIAQQYPQQSIAARQYLGVDYQCWQPAPTITICYGFLNSLFVCTWGEDTMRDLITRFTGEAAKLAPALATSPSYQDFVAQMPPGHELHLFLNVEPVMANLGPMLLMSPEGAAGLQQLASMRHMGFSVTVHPDTVEEVRLTAYQAGRHAAEPPSARRSLAFTTPQTLLYVVGPVDLAGVYDQLIQAIALSGQPEAAVARADFESQLSAAGVNLQQDLLEKIGPETALLLDWREGAAFPDFALIADLRDAAVTRPALDKVLTALKLAVLGEDNPLPWEETTAHDAVLRTVRVGDGRMAPTYTTTDQFLVLASTADATRALLDQATRGAATLTANEQYRAAMARLPDNGVTYAFCDLKAFYPHLHSLARSFGEQGGERLGVDLDHLPAAATVQPHLSPFGSAKISTPERDLTRSYSPFGSPWAVLAWGIGGHAINLARELSPPIAPSKSSNTRVPPGPSESQTAGSPPPGPQ